MLCFQSATFVLYGAVLGLIRQVQWKQVVFITILMALLTAVFHYAAFRMMLVVLCAVLLQRAMAAPVSLRLVWAALVGVTCLMAQLITAELGIQTILTAAVVLGAYTVFAGIRATLGRNDLLAPAGYMAMLGVIFGTFVVGNLLVSVLFKLSSPDYQHLFNYQWYNLEIILGYNYTMGIPWKPAPRVLWGALFVLLFVTGFVLGKLRKLEIADGYLLLSLLVSSWVVLKGMILRSDWGHTTLALIPTTFLLVLLGVDRRWTTKGRSLWAAALVVLFATWPGASFLALTAGSQMLVGELPLVPKLRQILAIVRSRVSIYRPVLRKRYLILPGQY